MEFCKTFDSAWSNVMIKRLLLSEKPMLNADSFLVAALPWTGQNLSGPDAASQCHSASGSKGEVMPARTCTGWQDQPGGKLD